MWERREPFEWHQWRQAYVVRELLIANLVAFVLQHVVDRRTGGLFTLLFGLSLEKLLQGELWRLGTYLFLHGGFWHILINMLSLVIFGRELEEHFGWRRFLVLYFLCGILGGLGWAVLSGSSAGLCIGASGAVFGIIGAFAALFPERQITLLLFLVFPITMTARTMALGMVTLTMLMLVSGSGNIAHAAHLAGGLAGYFYGRYWMRTAANWWTYGHPLRRGESTGGDQHEGSAGWSRLFKRESDPPDPEEVDRILEKIKAHGIGSLSHREREILDRASRQVGKSED